MLISKIGPTTSNTAFKGIFLEGNTQYIDNTYYDHGLEQDRGSTYKIINKEYYPYANESNFDISSSVMKAKEIKHFSDDLVERRIETQVIIKDKLPITEAEGKAFMRKFDVNERDFIKFIELIKLLSKSITKRL